MGLVSGLRYTLGTAVEGRDYVEIIHVDNSYDISTKTEEQILLEREQDNITGDDVYDYLFPSIESCLERANFGFTTIHDADTGNILTGDYCDQCGKYYESDNVNLYQCCPDCANESQSSYGWM